MRSIWNGSISFGLVNIPVKLYSATEEHDLTAHQVHAHDHGRIKYRKVCETCDKTVETRDMAKMFEVDGQVAVLTDEELKELPVEQSRVIDVLEFVPANSIDPLMLDKPYYLAPATAVSTARDSRGGSTKAYALLAQTLKGSGLVAIARFSMRSKTRLAALSVTGKGETMVAHTLRWPDEVREYTALDNTPELSDAEVSMAAQLVKSMTTEFNADRYRDTYKEELRELVAAKLSDAPEAVDEVSDLLAKLEASAAAKAPREIVPAKTCKPNIREWAKSRGLKVGVRGRIPQDIVDQFEREAVPA